MRPKFLINVLLGFSLTSAASSFAGAEMSSAGSPLLRDSPLQFDGDILPPIGGSPRISCQLVLDDSSGGTEELPFISPFTVRRLQVAGGGTLSDAASAPDGLATATVGFGFAQLYLRSSSTQNAAGVSGLFGNAEIQVSSRDTLTIMPNDPTLVGTRGRFLATLAITGAGSAVRPAAWEGISAGAAIGNYGVGLYTNGQSSASGGRWTSADGGGTVFSGQEPTTIQVSGDFVFGGAFDLELAISAQTSATGSLPGTASAFVDLPLIRWMGLTEVTDADGNHVPGFTVAAASGTAWASAVPIPEPHVTAVACLSFLLAIRRSRRRGRMRA